MHFEWPKNYMYDPMQSTLTACFSANINKDGLHFMSAVQNANGKMLLDEDRLTIIFNVIYYFVLVKL